MSKNSPDYQWKCVEEVYEGLAYNKCIFRRYWTLYEFVHAASDGFTKAEFTSMVKSFHFN